MEAASSAGLVEEFEEVFDCSIVLMFVLFRLPPARTFVRKTSPAPVDGCKVYVKMCALLASPLGPLVFGSRIPLPDFLILLNE